MLFMLPFETKEENQTDSAIALIAPVGVEEALREWETGSS